MTGGTWAIVPVKRLADAKSRLAPVLSPEQRQDLVSLMLEDVLRALSSQLPPERIVVVTPDRTVAALARGEGATVLTEMEPRGLNAAVEYGLAFARSRGALEALIVPGDVPLAQPSEFEAILAAAGPGKDRVVLVPCNAGEGTNAMLLAPPDALEPGFGPGSFVCHLAKAAARRLDTQIFHLPGLSADIDAPADVERLAAARERYRSFRPLPLEVRTPHATD